MDHTWFPGPVPGSCDNRFHCDPIQGQRGGIRGRTGSDQCWTGRPGSCGRLFHRPGRFATSHGPTYPGCNGSTVNVHASSVWANADRRPGAGSRNDVSATSSTSITLRARRCSTPQGNVATTSLSRSDASNGNDAGDTGFSGRSSGTLFHAFPPTTLCRC